MFPCLNYLKQALSREGFTYTTKIRKDLLKSLNERFSDYNENEVYLFSTFLDSNFGVNAFSEEMKLIVKGKISTFLKVESLKQQASCEKTVLNNSGEHAAVQKRNKNYIFYSNNDTTDESDTIEREIDKYIRILRSAAYESPLQFWKINHSKFPLLSRLAKKYLGIPASSAAVERMFSISGHIFSVKRRRLGIKIFEELVLLKLNENLLL